MGEERPSIHLWETGTVYSRLLCTGYLQGTVKQLLACGDHEGSPTVLAISGPFLVAGTDAGWVKVWDLSRR